jgi:rod shape determining protein RodA
MRSSTNLGTYSTISKLKFIPKHLLLLIFTLASIGFVMMYSAAKGSMSPWATKQILIFSFSIPLFLTICLTNIRIIYSYAYFLYGGSIILLILVLALGHKAMGATRWINLGFFTMQPSEVIKITIVIALARFFHSTQYKNINKPRNLAIAACLILLPFALIMQQPDLGTSLTLIIIAASVCFVAGLSKWIFITGAGIVGFSAPILWHFMHDYQKQRVLTFLSPDQDPLGGGYNIKQSMIAIGSGKFFGKGLLKGSQVQLNFLPEKQTDFVFTMFAEQHGFLGSIILLSIYMITVIVGVHVAANCKHQFGRILAFGISSLFFIHFFINMAMVMGLIPVVGSPLPMLSFGGTFMITNMIGFAIIANIAIHSRTSINKSITSFF